MAGRMDQAPAASAGTLSGRLDPLSATTDQEPGTMLPHPSDVPHPDGPPFRVLITGSRYATREAHWATIQDAILDAVGHLKVRELGRVVIVHGDAPGVDTIAAEIADRNGFKVEPHSARKFGPWPACGPLRNSHMVSLGADVCLGFAEPGSRGTWDCARKATDAGIPTTVVTLPAVSR